MIARITPYQMKQGAREPATELMNSLRDQIMALPGMLRFINVMNADGTGYVIAIVDSPESINRSQEKVRAIWSRFSDHLEHMPVPHIFEIVADWEHAPVAAE